MDAPAASQEEAARGDDVDPPSRTQCRLQQQQKGAPRCRLRIPKHSSTSPFLFESEMKEANEMLRESKQLRVNTTKPKTVTFAPILEQEPEPVKNDWHSKELSETATKIFSHAYAIVCEAVLRMVSIIQDAMSSYNIDRRQMLEKIVSFNRYMMLKLAPGEGDKVLSEVITEAVLDMFDAWCENVERPLVQRAKEVSSWFLPERREELPPVPLSTHPCVYEAPPKALGFGSILAQIMNEIRKLKRGISTKRGDHPVQNGQNPVDEWEEQQRYWPSPRAPPVSPMGSPRTPNGSQKKPVLGKVKSKAKKWMHLLHHKKKPQEEMMTQCRLQQQQKGAPRCRLRIPKHSSTSPFLFESEMKEANEMLRESKQLRVNTTKPKTVTFAPILEQEPEPVKNDWHSKELSETATKIFSHAYAIVCEAVLRMVSIIQDAMSSYNIDRRQMLEKIVSFNRYMMLKLAPGEGDKVLSEVITEAVLDMFDAWCENVERPLVQRAKEVSSWFLPERREELPPVPLSTHPCVYEVVTSQ
uniref:LTI65/LTI78 PGEED repeat domain-containing protein n=1 Tax=Oryza meridionalis TaxID=40149 RepID=A0A0E0BX10_9ORYZ